MADIFGTSPDQQLKNASFGRNGHDYIDSGHSPVASRTYFWFEVVSDAVVTYDDASGDTKTSKSISAGSFRDCSGVPSVASGEICAWINVPGGA